MENITTKKERLPDKQRTKLNQKASPVNKLLLFIVNFLSEAKQTVLLHFVLVVIIIRGAPGRETALLIVKTFSKQNIFIFQHKNTVFFISEKPQ